MKKFMHVTLATVFAIAGLTLGSLDAKAAMCDQLEDYFEGNSDSAMEFIGMTLFTTTSSVSTTSTVITCAISDNMELNRKLIEKEAAMVIETGQRYEPSFLGAYADQIDASSFESAAETVLRDGVK